MVGSFWVRLEKRSRPIQCWRISRLRSEAQTPTGETKTCLHEEQDGGWHCWRFRDGMMVDGLGRGRKGSA